jgi:hypothetical protein
MLLPRILWPLPRILWLLGSVLNLLDVIFITCNTDSCSAIEFAPPLLDSALKLLVMRISIIAIIKSSTTLVTVFLHSFHRYEDSTTLIANPIRGRNGVRKKEEISEGDAGPLVEVVAAGATP